MEVSDEFGQDCPDRPEQFLRRKVIGGFATGSRESPGQQLRRKLLLTGRIRMVSYGSFAARHQELHD